VQRCVLLYFVFIFPGLSAAQHDVSPADSNRKEKLPEVLTAGFFDVISNGQVNASARFLKIYIGEPERFYVPVSFYSGVSANSFEASTASRRSNDHLLNNFINPVTGIGNICIEELRLFRKKNSQLTRTGLLYQFGERVLSGYKTGPATEPSTGKSVNFLNSYLSGGFYLQTGAWDKNDLKNIGIFWLSLRYIFSMTSGKQLQFIFPDIETNGIYHGYSFGWGVDINKLVNLKVIYYKYLKAPEFGYGFPIYQFTFHYYMKNKE
jgi:hypothetical protein